MKHTVKLILHLLITLVMRLAFRVFYIFPIKRNRVMFQAFREKQYSCNPKYISMKLRELYGDDVEIGWSFRNPEPYRYLEKEGIKIFKSRTFGLYKFALTAKVICTNTYYKTTLPRRRGQYFIRTWHGGGAYKRVGSMEKMPYLKRKYLDLQAQGAHLYLSSSKAFTQMTIRDSFGYKGEVMECGMPRNDVLLNGNHEEIASRVKKALGLKDDERLALYAPTYRYDLGLDHYDIDYEGAVKALETRFGGKWRFAFRTHNFVEMKAGAKIGNDVVNATDYPDMQELLVTADVLFTDYSSSIWDMSLMHKPAFLYATDLKAYESGRDFYMDIHLWPFPLSENNAELISNILSFDEDKYREDVDSHHKTLGSCETGHASEMVAKRIYDVMTKG